MRTETVKSERRDAQPLPLLISHQKLARRVLEKEDPANRLPRQLRDVILRREI